MITNKTVLILGAGASNPYQYPLGEKLRMDICDNITLGHSAEILNKYGFKGDDIRNFRNEFFNSGKYTIDEFLEKRKEFTEIGKMAIALELVPKESNEILNKIPNSENWYRLVFNKMDTELYKFPENKISFITFNYDRSLENFMFNALKSSSGGDFDEVAKVLKQINIIHLYGQLGVLPWQDKVNGIEYENTKETGSIYTAARGIKIIYENSPKDKDFLKTHELLHEAEKIYFLGFGFNPTNLKRLNITSIPSKKEIAGTSIGLSTHDIKDVELNSKHRINSSSLFPNNIVDFFRNHFRLD